MAYTKIHAIKATVNKAIAYITNPDKTDEKMLVDSYACSPESADIEFDFALKKTISAGPNKAYHLIQSFMPGEVSYDEAHAIGKELAERLLNGQYSYILATHIDHEHIHNHIIFCAADNIHHRKYDDNKRSYHHIRHLSDKLCMEHNLSIINVGKKRGVKYNEWASGKESTSYKKRLLDDIDSIVSIASSYENFLELMKAKGYEIKGENLSVDSPKYISFRPMDSKNFIRGSAKSLGESYTKEKIKDRIDRNKSKEKIRKTPFPKRPQTSEEIKIKSMDDIIKRTPKDITKDPRQTLIDTSTDKMLSSPSLLRWANVSNLKAAAHAYASINKIKDIEEAISEKRLLIKETKSSLVELEKKMKTASEILHYAEIYKDNLRYHNAMLRSKDPDRYYREHDTKLTLFYAAEHVLNDKFGIIPSKMNYHTMTDGYSLMEDKKVSLTSTWKQHEKDLKNLESALSTLNEYIGKGAAESMQSHIQEEAREDDKTQSKNDQSL